MTGCPSSARHSRKKSSAFQGSSSTSIPANGAAVAPHASGITYGSASDRSGRWWRKECGGYKGWLEVGGRKWDVRGTTSHFPPPTSYLLPPTSYLLPLTSYVLRLTSHVSRLTSHLSRLTSHVSRLTSHLSRLTSHLSPLTSHLSFLT